MTKIALPFTDPLYDRQEPALERQIQHAAHWTPGRRQRTRLRVSCLLTGPDPGPSPESVCRRPRLPRGAEPCSNACAVSHAVPVAVLYCCTADPAVGIMSLTSGAKGTRTPDPLLANNRQGVHHCPSPQLTVPGRPSVSLCIRSCCGTSVLYFPGRPLASVPAAVPRSFTGSRSRPHRPGRGVLALTQH